MVIAAGSRRRSPEAAALFRACLRDHRAGRLAAAAAGYRQVLSKAPDDPDALHLLGLVALDQGEPARATALIQQAISHAPRYAAAHSSLGNALRAVGRATEAEQCYRRAIELDPKCTSAFNNLGLLLYERGDFDAAVAHCRRAVELAPRLAEAHNNLGNALRGLRRFEAAESALRRAVELEPTAARETNLANVLADLGRADEAEQGYRAALERNPEFALALHGLGARLLQRGEVTAAVEYFRDAVQRDPGLVNAWHDLGVALRALGRIDAAVEAFRRTLDVDPNHAEAYRDLAVCGGIAAEGASFAAAAALATDADRPLEQRAAALFALGKTLDDAERYDEAFAAYQAANRNYREHLSAGGIRFDSEALRRNVDVAIERHTRSHFAVTATWGNPSESPVFIVGMPRSGTTLVEQILASHSRVFGAGERKEIGAIAIECESALAAGDRRFIRRRADRHLAWLANLGGGAARVVDKLPDNVFQLGVIATLFPGARVICCWRDPRDLCLSCYFQRFAGDRLPFSYDLDDCATRFIETSRLAAHWANVLPLRWHDVWYEDVIADLEGESRRLIAFLGLEWESRCLEFHRTSRVVTTASAWQVRQPLYDRSVGRWRNYRRHLAPLLERLAHAGERGLGGANG